MRPERKAEVNRRLAEFEGWERSSDDSWWYLQVEPTSLMDRPELPDYTADLNALARLETKLPPHGWTTSTCGNGNIWVQLETYGEETAALLPPVANEPTESEARAEAICQYLESSHAPQS